MSPDAPATEGMLGDRAPTEHDITLRAMGNDAELDRLLRLERGRNRAHIWRFVVKTAAVAGAVVVVFYAASGLEIGVPDQAWPVVSLAGATGVTALVGLAVARLASRRDAGAANDGQNGGTGQPPVGGAP